MAAYIYMYWIFLKGTQIMNTSLTYAEDHTDLLTETFHNVPQNLEERKIIKCYAC